MGISSEINALIPSSAQIGAVKDRVMAAIHKASQKAGVDFSYLLNKAEQESGLDPAAKASTSSATGLYQFIDQTWLKTVKESGAKYGLSAAADKIAIGSDGLARVANEADRKAILALRNNPEIAAEMAAELTKSNQQALEAKLGASVGGTELYLAHFLGANGAASLLSARQANPNAKAASILPEAAAANKSVFYDVSGRARSVSEIYDRFAAKFDGDGAKTQIASSGGDAADAVQRNWTRALTSESLAGNGSGAVHLKNGVTIDKTISSPFATMMLAQMDRDIFGLSAMNVIHDAEQDAAGEKRVKSVLSTLAAA